jgi:hypothetical protein
MATTPTRLASYSCSCASSPHLPLCALKLLHSFFVPKQHFLYLCILLRPSQWFANISLLLCAVSFLLLILLILLLLVSFLLLTVHYDIESDTLVRAPRGQETRTRKSSMFCTLDIDPLLQHEFFHRRIGRYGSPTDCKQQQAFF